MYRSRASLPAAAYRGDGADRGYVTGSLRAAGGRRAGQPRDSYLKETFTRAR